MDPPPGRSPRLAGFELTVCGDWEKAFSATNGPLKATRSKDRLTIQVPFLQGHDVLVLE